MDSGGNGASSPTTCSCSSPGDRTAFAIGLGSPRRPDDWAYNNAAVQTLEQSSGRQRASVASASRSSRCSCRSAWTHTTMRLDKAGNAQMFEGIHSSCRDLARFGVLMLDHGRWSGKRLVSRSWVEAATGMRRAAQHRVWLPLVAQPQGRAERPAHGDEHHGGRNPSTKQSRIAPDAPNDMYWALGLGNQLIQIDPGTRTVVVRLGTPKLIPKPPTFGPREASHVVTQAVQRRGTRR